MKLGAFSVSRSPTSMRRAGSTTLGDHDVRIVQAALRGVGIEPTIETDPDGTGPAHIVVADPDGNTVMVDQHVDRPGDR